MTRVSKRAGDGGTRQRRCGNDGGGRASWKKAEEGEGWRKDESGRRTRGVARRRRRLR
ncbi:hypothetical protein BJY59DRAFT_707029 [Rhodotorula toruloides]